MLKNKKNINKFIIIGAGPVGLWTSIQLKRRDPDSEVIIYERHKIYQREHILKIQHSSLFFGSSKKKSSFDNLFYKSVFDKSKMSLYTTPLKKSFVSTQKIEDGLLNYSKNLGCKIIYKEIQNLDELFTEYGKESYYIIANGAKSKIRDIYFKEGLEKDDLQYIVEFKSFANKKLTKLKKQSLNQFNNLGFEYIGKEDNGKTPFNLRLFISKKDYNKVPEASFKNPVKSLDSLPDSIKNDLILYAKKQKISITDLFENGQLSKIQLSVYASKKFAVNHNGYKLFLTGDAAMGVPYFRSLNSGLVLSSRLAHIFNLTNNPVDYYNNYKPIHKHAEFTLAKSKNMALNTYSELRKLYNG